MSAPTSGRVSKLATRVRTVAAAQASPELGAKALRLVFRELLHDGSGVPDWQRAAACADTEVDREIFYPPDGWAGDLATTAAKQVCARCPVRAQCLADALAWENPRQRHGVLGGLTAAERAALTSNEGGEAA